MSVRLSEIDALRGVAILGMIVFTRPLTMKLLGMLDFEPYGWPLIIFVRAIQFYFGIGGSEVALSSRGIRGASERGVDFFGGYVGELATRVLFRRIL